MITYNDIYDASRKERYGESLQPLQENFILEVKGYLNEKKQIALKESSTFSDVIVKTKKQIENAQTLFKELMRIRRKKILGLVLIASETGISKKDFSNMLSFEKELFENLMKNIEKSDSKIEEVMSSKGKVEDKRELEFKENVGEFMDSDGKKIGPFKKGSRVFLKKEVASILTESGKAEEVKD